MKTAIVGMSAKYAHTSLAARALAAACQKNGETGEILLLEYTVNQPGDRLLQALFEENPDVILFSCYLWNFEPICRLLPEITKLLCGVKIFLGGPQVSFHAKELLGALPIDGILIGEGEISVPALLCALRQGAPICTVPSLCYREESAIKETQPAAPVSLCSLPFCYEDIQAIAGRTIYYESSRGCPFSCAYCLSGLEKTVRYKPLEMVFSELARFLHENVRQVKLCDRTFNCDGTRALAIWRFLAEHDNGVSNFHFEIAADLITREQLVFLAGVRRGLFQFEIGVQSLNEKTLLLVNRRTDLARLFFVCRQLKKQGNIHLHLDLIAGLPGEDLKSFSRSFSGVYSLLPDALQLGFLKLLPGSDLKKRQQSLGLVCRSAPPYEVLYTSELSPGDLFLLKGVEKMVEQYYNSGAFSRSLSYLLPHFEDAFSLFLALAEYQKTHHLLDTPHSLTERCDIMARFAAQRDGVSCALLCEYILFDICHFGKPKKLPDCLLPRERGGYSRAIRAFYASRENAARYFPGRRFDPAALRAISHIEVFSFNIFAKKGEPGKADETALLFDYSCAPTRVCAVPLA